MKIKNLLNESDLHIVKSRLILKESCDGLTTEQRIIVEGIYGELRPLIEASMSADQIQQLFAQVQKSATDGGSNRTMLGKGVDTAKKANEIIDNIGKWLQDTAPVKAFDQKFDQLKNKINTSFPDSKILDGISNLGIYAKENPGKTAAVIGVLTAIASLAGGPIGGAIAGQVLRGAVELLKGEKLSTAVGKGIKTAALGYLSGKAFEVLGDWVGDFRAKSIPFGPKDAGLERVDWGATRTLSAPGMTSSETLQGFNIVVGVDQKDAVEQAMNAIRNGEAGGFDTLKSIAKEITSPDYKAAVSDIMKGARMEQLDNDSLMQWIDGVAKAGQALSQGAVAASTGSEKKESYYIQTRPLSEGQVYMMFANIQRIDEGPMDLLKKGAAAVSSKASQVGTNLTTKVTADKLSSAWKAAGSPTDSNEIAAFLEKQGVDTAIVDQVFTSMKLPAPGTSANLTPAETWTYTNPTTGTKYEAGKTEEGTLIIKFDGEWETVEDEADSKAILAAQQAAPAVGTDFESVKTMIAKLPVDRKARLLKYLTKQPQVV